MTKNKGHEEGIRVEIVDGDNEAVAVDKLVDDFIHGRTQDALADLHEPHADESARER